MVADPYLFLRVERACALGAREVAHELRAPLYLLASISATAALVGLLGTTLSMLFYTFVSAGSSRATILAATTRSIAASLVPGALGILISVAAFTGYCLLIARAESLAGEMELEGKQLASLLRALVRRSGSQGRFHYKLRLPASVTRSRENSVALVQARMFRNGVLELVWPQMHDHESLERHLAHTRTLLFLYAVLAWLSYRLQGVFLPAVLVSGMFLVCAFALSRLPLAAPVAAAIMLASSAVYFAFDYGATLTTVWLLAAALPLLSAAVNVFRYKRRML